MEAIDALFENLPKASEAGEDDVFCKATDSMGNIYKIVNPMRFHSYQQKGPKKGPKAGNYTYYKRQKPELLATAAEAEEMLKSKSRPNKRKKMPGML